MAHRAAAVEGHPRDHRALLRGDVLEFLVPGLPLHGQPGVVHRHGLPAEHHRVGHHLGQRSAVQRHPAADRGQHPGGHRGARRGAGPVRLPLRPALLRLRRHARRRQGISEGVSMNQPSRRTFLAGAGGGAAALALAACTSTPPNSAPGEGNTSAAAANRSGAPASYGVGTQFKASTPLKFSIMILSNPVYPYNANWLFFTQLKKMTNVSFNPTVVPFADYNTKVQTLIAAGQQPYIIPKTYPGQEDAFVAGGQILPVSDYVHLMPNYQAKVAAWNLDGDLNTIRQSDGKYYLLPGLRQSVPSDYTMGVRTDLMAKYNIATPSTLAQVEGMLMTLKDNNPGHYPFSDRWNQPTPGGAFLQMVGNAHGTMAGWNYQSFNQGAVYDYGTKQWVFAASMPQYQQMVTLLNGWYNKGLIDPESFTQPDTQALAKFTTGKSLAIMENAQYVVTDQKALKPGWTVGKVPVPIGPTGATVYGPRLDAGLMISAKAAQDPNFVAMMEFIDWLWYSDAGMLFARWGVEGTTYTG